MGSPYAAKTDLRGAILHPSTQAASSSPPSLEMAILIKAHPTEKIVLRYTPSTTDEDLKVSYSDPKVPGVVSELPEYTRTGPKTRKFQLFLNEFGDARSPAGSVEATIAWLYAAAYPRKQTTNDAAYEERPPVLQVVNQGKVFECVLESISVKRTMFRPRSDSNGTPGQAIRAEVDLTLQECSGTARPAASGSGVDFLNVVQSIAEKFATATAAKKA